MKETSKQLEDRVVVIDGNNTTHLQQLTIGRDYGTTLEVLQGLKSTDWIVLNPADSLEDDMKVNAVLGVPYTGEMIEKAKADVRTQATTDAPEAGDLVKRYLAAYAQGVADYNAGFVAKSLSADESLLLSEAREMVTCSLPVVVPCKLKVTPGTTSLMVLLDLVTRTPFN